MQSLDKRITALETVNAPSEPLSIFRRIVVPGQLNAEMHHISDDDRKQWTRVPGETENTFMDRAVRETMANVNAVKWLIGNPLEMSCATN